MGCVRRWTSEPEGDRECERLRRRSVRGYRQRPTIRAIEAEVEKINSSNILPPSVHIQRIYDRTELINITTHTVLHNMITGIILILLSY